MHDLKRITVTERTSKYRGLHIEAPGCIVNIIKDVFDAIHNRKITVVDIIPDQYVGEEWCLADLGDQKQLHVRVAQGKPVPHQFIVEPDSTRGARKVIYLTYRGRQWRLEFVSNAGLGYYATLRAKDPDVALFLGELNSTRAISWPNAYEEYITKAKVAIKNLYALVEGN